jgi:hypothetical protein
MWRKEGFRWRTFRINHGLHGWKRIKDLANGHIKRIKNPKKISTAFALKTESISGFLLNLG